MKLPRVVGGALALLGLGSAASGQASFELLGTPVQGMPAWATAVSSDGSVVVGAYFAVDPPSWKNQFSWRWTESGGMVSIGGMGSTPTGVSGAGDVLSVVFTNFPYGEDYAYVWSPLGGFQPVPTLCLKDSVPWAISADGSTVVGSTCYLQKAWRWHNGVMEVIGPSLSGFARDVSSDGSVIAAEFGIPWSGSYRPARWTPKDGVEYLFPVGTGTAGAISDNGQFIAGVLWGHGAYRWDEVGGSQLIADEFLMPRGVSDDGRVMVLNPWVGGTEPLIWLEPWGVLSLDTLLLLQKAEPPQGWTVAGAAGVTPDGRTIVGGAAHTDGAVQPYRARLFPLCYANCNLDTLAGGVPRLDVNDFICFQLKFILNHPYADCDGDGALTVNDFICFQTAFALGCPAD